MHKIVVMKTMHIKITLLAVLFTFLAIGPSWPQSAAPASAKYIFFFIGDGMGTAQVNSAQAYMAAMDGSDGFEKLTFTQFPYTGIAYTNALDRLITGSAAAGTALATGNKTNIGRISMDPDGKKPYETIAEKAKKEGMKVGIITSVSIDHATPAVFYAHQNSRDDYFEIGIQLANSSFDLFAGGGLREPEGEWDGEKINLFEMASQKGFNVINNNMQYLGFPANGERVFYVHERLADGAAMPFKIDRQPGDISLGQVTGKAIELLDNENGFFMMVEGGKIDWACHTNDAAASIHDVIDFDDAVSVAYDFYLQHPDQTLIVVTADHETGGMSLGSGKTGYDMHISNLKYQRYSIEQLAKNLDDLMRKWRDDPEKGKEMFLKFLENDFGLGHGKRIPLTDEEKESLTKQFMEEIKKASTGDADSYSSGNLAGRVIAMMSDVSGIGWTSRSHTASGVPVYAIGAGAENFTGLMDNTDIPKKMEAVSVFGQREKVRMD